MKKDTIKRAALDELQARIAELEAENDNIKDDYAEPETEEEETEMEYIYNSLEGKRFVLRQDPYLDGPAGTRGYYTALATCPDDIPDENWEVPLYQVYWDIRPAWDGVDEEEACDWDEIVSWDDRGTV